MGDGKIIALVRDMETKDVEKASKVLCSVLLETWERYEKDVCPRRALDFDISVNTPEKLTEKLSESQGFFFVAEEDEAIVGVAYGNIVGESGLATLDWIGVLPKYQHRGIGKALMQKVIKHCAEKGCHKIILYTLPVDVPAINLYLKSGFVPEAYFHKEWWKVDIIKMSLWLET